MNPLVWISDSISSCNFAIFCETTILAAVICWCSTWPVILREEFRPRVFEKRVLRRIFGRNREEVTRGWRKLQSEELHELCSPNIISIN
jgi:hypothetical protein